MQDIFVGRQPIYNRNLGVYGYEMLFRDSAKNMATMDSNEDAATSQVIINTFMEMGVDNLVGTRKVCINLTQRLLLNNEALPLPPDCVILDIQPTINIDKDMLTALQRLKNAGFTLALEGFHDTPHFDELLRHVDIFNLDIHAHSKEDNIVHIEKLKNFNLKMRAGKVQTLDEYEEYMHLGFDYFQGYFLSQPRIFRGKKLETNKLSLLQLLSTLHNSDTELSAIEDAITRDLTISYKLLKLINSAFFNLPSKVESIKRAVVVLGRKKITSWASMLALSSMNDQPMALIKISMVRARSCELIAKKLGLKNEDQYFTVGMFSALDILMQRPLDVLLDPLPLTDEIKQAILNHTGRLGLALKCSKRLETADASRLSIKGIDRNELSKLYLEADNWAQQVTQTIQT